MYIAVGMCVATCKGNMSIAVGMCVATCKGKMFIALCKTTIFINITRNPHTLFSLFICILPHALHTDNTRRQTLTTAYEPVIHDRGSRQITFCSSHCAYSYNQYINLQLHLITFNSWQISNCYMIRHKGAIRRKSFWSKAYKPFLRS
jgi:hypothetical protein